jgi:23S rRNA (guanosine2251-2'-O)-methyltransferase
VSVRAGIHPVLEALRAGSPLNRVLIAKGVSGPRIQEIIEACRAQSIPLRFEPREALDRAAAGAMHQGVVALGAAHQFIELEDVPEGAPLAILDGVEDPHNLGAIVRTAHAAGLGAIVVPERRAAGLTETVARAAAGALDRLPVARVGNISQALDRLKKRGYWIYGLDERGDRDYDKADYASPVAFVLGGEGKGLHEMIRRRCDFVVRIPLAGHISSLNVSVAAGVVFFDWKRRRTH